MVLGYELVPVRFDDVPGWYETRRRGHEYYYNTSTIALVAILLSSLGAITTSLPSILSPVAFHKAVFSTL